jgi:hypothetical protein
MEVRHRVGLKMDQVLTTTPEQESQERDEKGARRLMEMVPPPDPLKASNPAVLIELTCETPTILGRKVWAGIGYEDAGQAQPHVYAVR